ncbi:DUF3219 family protein [Bacillus dakarensis]|uniref:DUF3219 family protein n=1 Tax=Robertmurraya dakarensis TaxID=1926278 RepID=UPI001115989F|nr:DUF3219 family protein [Bacillus dakarensis]
MAKEIILNNRQIQVERYNLDTKDGRTRLSLEFKVSSEDYHDIATLLYEGTFDVRVPECELSFRGSIHEYSTSITNLYEKGKVGDYKITLVEEKK